MPETKRPFTAAIPDRVAELPTDHRGYPVPWFVATIDGKPDFRVIRPGGFQEAITGNKCWICGQPLGGFKAFTIGPMCAVNRTTAEPPSHRECAIFAAIACPFLSKPHMRRREAGMPDGIVEAAGMGLKRNPGVALVWVTKKYALFRPHGGRDATRAECLASIESGRPALQELAAEEGPRAEGELQRLVDRAMRYLPTEGTNHG